MRAKLHEHADLIDVAEGAVSALDYLWHRLLRQGIIESLDGSRLTEPVVMVATTVAELRALLAELDHEGVDPRVRELRDDLREMVEGAPGFVP